MCRERIWPATGATGTVRAPVEARSFHFLLHGSATVLLWRECYSL